MRSLTLNEMSMISGSGINTEGYNFSFIVANAVTVGVIGFFFVGADFLTCAGVGAAYGALMLAAKVADNYFEF